MKMDEKSDQFFRDLVRQQPLEKAPEGFTGRVMEKIQPEGMTSHEPLFSPMTWVAFFLGAAAIVTTLLFLDIPLINDIFSSSGIQKLSLNIFSSHFYESFLGIFKDIQINTTAIIILAAVTILVVIERVLAGRKSSQSTMMF